MAWNRTSRQERGYGAAWDALRAAALARDLGLCQSCLRAGRTTPATCGDHVQPRAAGGHETLANVQSLCDPCHADKTARETGARLRVPLDAHGWPDYGRGETYRGPLWVRGRQVRG